MSIQQGYGTLRRVYVRPPRAEDLGDWRDCGWHHEPDVDATLAQHEAFRESLSADGAEVIVGETPVPGDPDAIYTYDPVLPTDEGVILLRPGKPGRRGEPEVAGREIEATGMPIRGRLTEPAFAEGGDMCFLDPSTLLVGLGYRTNEDGVTQLRAILEPSGVTVHAFDLPHRNGPDECLHLLSFLSPLDADLAVAHLPMMPVRLVRFLRERGVALVEVPGEEFDTMASNVLALGPRVALALEGSPETRRRMEAAGVEVRTYPGEHISRNGDGGPTCLTRPLDRG